MCTWVKQKGERQLNGQIVWCKTARPLLAVIYFPLSQTCTLFITLIKLHDLRGETVLPPDKLLACVWQMSNNIFLTLNVVKNNMSLITVKMTVQCLFRISPLTFIVADFGKLPRNIVFTPCWQSLAPDWRICSPLVDKLVTALWGGDCDDTWMIK